MITFLREDIDNGEGASCKQCTWYEPTDLSVGQWGGCLHPLLTTDSGEEIEPYIKAIQECLCNPRHCPLMDISAHLEDELHLTKKRLNKTLAELSAVKLELIELKNNN